MNVLIFLLVAMQTPAPAAYQWTCESQVALPDGGNISGSVTVGEDGQLSDFFARALPAETVRDRSFNSGPITGSRDASNARWAVEWRGYGLVPEIAGIAFADGTLQLELARRGTLPRLVAVTLRRTEADAAAVVAFGQRWPGRKSAAQFDVPMPYLLGIAAGRSDVTWTLYRRPLDTPYYSSHWIASGALPLDGIRAVEPAFATFRQALLTLTAMHRTACRRGERPPPSLAGEI